MDKLNYDAVIERLFLLDLHCERNSVDLKITIFGGAAILIRLGDEKFRQTSDIDYRIEEYSSEEKITEILEEIGVFQNMFGLPYYPDRDMYSDGVESFKFENAPFSNLTILLPTIEMLALSKLMSDRGKDLEDLLEMPIMDDCDLELLKEYADECKSYMHDREYQKSNFSNWEDILKKRALTLNT